MGDLLSKAKERETSLKYFHTPSCRGRDLKEQAASIGRAGTAETGQGAGGKRTVLVIDDEDSILNLIRELLERQGYTVVTADSGRAGLDGFARLVREIGLVIVDRSMPHMDGSEVSRRIKDIDPTMPIILTSGEDRETLKEQCRDLGLEGFLCKPFRRDVLMDQVRRNMEPPDRNRDGKRGWTD